MRQMFRVGITRDFLKRDGSPAFRNIGLDLLDHVPGIIWEFLESGSPELRADQIRLGRAVTHAPSVNAAMLAGADGLLLLARFGVGVGRR